MNKGNMKYLKSAIKINKPAEHVSYSNETINREEIIIRCLSEIRRDMDIERCYFIAKYEDGYKIMAKSIFNDIEFVENKDIEENTLLEIIKDSIEQETIVEYSSKDRSKYNMDKDIKFAAVIPMIAEGQVVMAMYLENRIEPYDFDEMKHFKAKFLATHWWFFTRNMKKQSFLRADNQHLENIVADRTKKLEDTIKKLQEEADRNNKIQERLIESEERYRNLYECSPDAICVHVDYKIVMANSAAVKLFGRTEESEVIGRNILGFVKEEYHDIVRQRVEIITNGAKNTKAIEEKFIAADGKIVDVEVATTQFKYKGQRAIQVVVRDITDRKNMEKILVESKERYKEILRFLPYAVFIKKGDKLLFLNKTAGEYIGVKERKQALGRKVSEFVTSSPEYSKVERKYLHDKLAGDEEIAFMEERILRKSDGKMLDIETVATNCIFEDEDAILVVCREISDRKKSEELQIRVTETEKQLDAVAESEKDRKEFFANISHELRTPLNVILGALQLVNLNVNAMERSIQRENIAKYSVIMKQNCYRLVRLVNNLIDTTKIDSGYFQVNLSNCDIVNIVEDITLSVAEYIENKGISLLFDTDVEEKVIACDPDKIERIVLNLISNAVKFTPRGGSIMVDMKDMGDDIRISVKDSGIGIAKEKQKMIFERFVQVDKSLARANEGSGIGLSLVKALVEMHGGDIHVESKVDEGSEFIINMPIHVLSKEDNIYSENSYDQRGNIEKIKIEFSDIYM